MNSVLTTKWTKPRNAPPGKPPRKTAARRPLETTSSMSVISRKRASFLPEYSVNVPPTISVSAWGMSKGVRSSLAWTAMRATRKPSEVGQEEERLGLVEGGDFGQPPGVGQDGRAEDGQEERHFVAEEHGQDARAADHREGVGRGPAGQEEDQRRQAEEVEEDDDVAGEGDRARDGQVEVPDGEEQARRSRRRPGR